MPKFTLLLVCTMSVYYGAFEAIRVRKLFKRKRAEYEAVNLHYLQKYNTTETNEQQTNFEEPSLSHIQDDKK